MEFHCCTNPQLIQFILYSNPSSEIICTNLVHLLRLKRCELLAWEGCIFWNSRPDDSSLSEQLKLTTDYLKMVRKVFSSSQAKIIKNAHEEDWEFITRAPLYTWDLGHPSAKMYVEGEIVETKLFVIISKLKLEIHSGNLEILRLFGKDVKMFQVAQLSFLSRKLRIQNLLHRCFLRSRMYVVYFLGAAAEQGKWLRNYLLMMNFWLKFSYGMSNDLITVF
ncbi:hypothetical protein T4E_9139 [Trichinella pseudospiralis]|uniref:Uncharacterized protein n=1 Tax=Trichinella pseudospiralis TaxID=6337 RepID=A0A0V0XKZ2_TRIPS|nr:hypothetical protein T4E_11828 [Trichinella pseudospiralis]KRX88651.1 hypothetical protein T4E_9139 [Trichinella pseudospiralis]